MEPIINAKIIYPLLSKSWGKNVAKVAIALRAAGIVDEKDGLRTNLVPSACELKRAAEILDLPESRLQQMFAVRDVPVVPPGRIFSAASGGDLVYDPSVPIRVPPRVYGRWIFKFIDGRREEVENGDRLTEEQMNLVRRCPETNIRRRYHGSDEFQLDREAIALEFQDGNPTGKNFNILVPLADFLEDLSQKALMRIEKAFLIGSFGWGCFTRGDDVDLVLITDLDRKIDVASFWQIEEFPLALRIFSSSEWRAAESLREEFLMVPKNDYDSEGYRVYKNLSEGVTMRVATLGWYHNYLELD